MQAIRTKYIPRSTHKGARICAESDSKRRYYSWAGLDGNGWDPSETHAKAANLFASELDWLRKFNLVSGSLRDGSYAHVLVPKESVK